MRKKEKAPPGAKERILQTAVRLFRRQGYPATGINQIIDESRTAKASFYQYFPSKDDLGRSFLDQYGSDQLQFLKNLTDRYEDPGQFIKAWLGILKREIRGGNFYGCMLANLRAQMPDSSGPISRDLKSLTGRTLDLLEDYFKKLKEKGRLPRTLDPAGASRRVFSVYEGVLQTWHLTGDASALDDMLFLSERIWK